MNLFSLATSFAIIFQIILIKDCQDSALPIRSDLSSVKWPNKLSFHEYQVNSIQMIFYLLKLIITLLLALSQEITYIISLAKPQSNLLKL